MRGVRPLSKGIVRIALCPGLACRLILFQTSSIGYYIRPDFNTYMDVQNSVHPLLDYNSQVMPIANDIVSCTEIFLV